MDLSQDLSARTYNRCFPSLLAFTSFLRFTFAVLQKPCQENFEKFQEFGESSLAVLKKVVIFENSKMAA